jgi:hypothetical protein
MPVEVPMGGEEFRRSVYVQVRRSKPLGFLNTFDAPLMEVNCERRQSSTVATQALMLMNSDFILDQARHFAVRLRRECGSAQEAQIRRAWQLAFGRAPGEHEAARSMEFLRRQVNALNPSADTTAGEQARPAGEKEKPDPELQALTNLCQALLSANELLYIP